MDLSKNFAKSLDELTFRPGELFSAHKAAFSWSQRPQKKPSDVINQA